MSFSCHLSPCFSFIHPPTPPQPRATPTTQSTTMNMNNYWSLPDPKSTTIRSRKDCRSLRRRDGLIKYAYNNKSQNGEDGIIKRLFELLPFAEKRHCVDVGAWDGVHLSNTYSLLVDETNQHTQSEWSGVLIEADQERFEELKTLHNQLDNIAICAEVSCDPSSPQSLISILKRDSPDLPQNFDFLSIDVDGMDYWIMANILGLSTPDDVSSDSYHPNVICVEFNPTMPTDLVYVQPRSDSIRHGSSLSAFVELATACDYVLVETTLFNAFFVKSDLYQQFLKEEVPDTTIEALQSPLSMGTQLYQLYDGTLKLHGCKRMLWHRIPIEEKKIQMISEDERQFPFSPSHNNNTNDEVNRIRDDAIDMTPYCKKDSNSEDGIISKQRCSAELNRMLQKDGFALVRGTGISGATCDNALRAARTFLHEADESVRRSCLTKDRARRGYSPTATENFASLVGKEGANDLVRKFRVGPEGDQQTSSPLHQPNAWPSAEVWGDDDASFFVSSIEEYFEQTRIAADCILCAICDGINEINSEHARSVDVLSNQSNNHTSILTLLGYQYGSRHKKGSKGYMRPLVAAHTDVGVITVLLYDSGTCAKLQRIADASKADPTTEDWVDIKLPAGPYYNNEPVFVVNVGDCLSKLTGNSLRSTLHRVMPHPCKKDDREAARSCLALFVGLEPSAVLTLPHSGERLTYEEWRRGRIARATAVLKNNSAT